MYTRPDIAGPVPRDDRGDPIPYGSRWPAVGAPEEFYSTCEHPERFRPLLAVGRALLDHLVATYDVVVSAPETAGPASGRDGIRRLVLLTPQDPAAAPLALALHDPVVVPTPAGRLGALRSDEDGRLVLGPEDLAVRPPGVRVRAGALFTHSYPDCGCDGCDEPIAELADDLERHIFAVVGGRLRERLTGVGHLEHLWVLGHGSPVYESASRRVDPRAPEVQEAARVLMETGGSWAPWPLRGP